VPWVRQGIRGWADQIQHPNRPVTGVSWWEAMAWCMWVENRLRRRPEGVNRVRVEEGEQLRLPTAAEWERAARGTDGRPYPWGEGTPVPEWANYDQNVGVPTPVGVYPGGATPDGIQDLTGNVWEWCLDGYDAQWYSKCRDKGVVRNPVAYSDAASQSHVLRGGSFRFRSEGLRATYRNRGQLGDRFQYRGFRCVLGPHLSMPETAMVPIFRQFRKMSGRAQGLARWQREIRLVDSR
jgi:formylglycine-generating enzyme required for sulfatase activity